MTNDSFDAAYDYLASLSSSLTCLMDERFDLYNSYSAPEFGAAVAPYPRQVLINREGVITYLSAEIDTKELREAIDAALSE